MVFIQITPNALALLLASSGVFNGGFVQLLRYLPAGQSSMCNSTTPVDRRVKPCTHAKFRAKKDKRLGKGKRKSRLENLPVFG